MHPHVNIVRAEFDKPYPELVQNTHTMDALTKPKQRVIDTVAKMKMQQLNV